MPSQDASAATTKPTPIESAGDQNSRLESEGSSDTHVTTPTAGPGPAGEVLIAGDPSQQWYKTAVIYQLHVRAFFDSKDDGIGDFAGLTQKLDYLQDLGVTAIWLLPFYPSPLKDDGYDIANYTDVNPSYGTLKDFKVFLREAHRRGLKVITELVLNHTSDQHPWFQRARRAKPGTWQRDFYVWSKAPDKYLDARIIFKDFEASNWTLDPVAGAYYWHRFYSHQPDLNFENPKVKEALFQCVDYWLDLGVDGLRLDAVPYLHEREGTNCENLPETHQVLKELRKHVDDNYSERMLLAEANQWPEDAVAYFGDGDECHAAFHFPVMPRLFMAVQMEDRYPIVDILQQTPAIPHSAQWFTFLRNHDELTLEMVTDEERDYMYRMYAVDRQARINLGIRRRLAPLLGNNRRKIELLNALLFSLPGTPVIYYGDEIGMGDNIYLGDRNGVRTPMQWSADRNGGFSRANPQKLYLPLVVDPEYLFETVNVETQRNNPQSLWWWMKRLIALRQRYPAFGRGDLEMLHPENPKVLSFLRRDGDDTVLVVANMSRFSQYVELDLSAYDGVRPVEMFGQNKFPAISKHPYVLTLGPHAFYWFSLPKAEPIGSTGTKAAQPGVVHVRENWDEVFRGAARTALEAQFSRWLSSRRWFAGKARTIQQLRLTDAVTIGRAVKQPRHAMAVLRVDYTQGEGESYSIPLAFASSEEAERIAADHADWVIARVHLRHSKTYGLLFDALQDQRFVTDVFDTIVERRQNRNANGESTGWNTKAVQTLKGIGREQLVPNFLGSDQSNSSVAFGERAIVKIFRRLEVGINPELEIGRQLTDTGNFENTPKLLGAIEYLREAGEEPMTLAVMHEYLPNSISAWKHALDALGRFLENCLATRNENPLPALPRQTLLQLALSQVTVPTAEMLGGYTQAAALLGQRTAEMHLALSKSKDDPAFRPEPFTQLYQRALYQTVRKEVMQSLAMLKQQLPHLPVASQTLAHDILNHQKHLIDSLKRIAGHKMSAQRTRAHGDYHLGQVLHTGKDFVILDFEGEPARSLSERRNKRSPLQDLAGMIRSFQYAGHYGLTKVGRGGLGTPEEAPFLAQAARLWATWSSVAFLRSYFDHAEHAEYLPSAATDKETLLNHYLIEKAVYELRYELNNRPDWVDVPMHGILELASGAREEG